MTATDQAFFPGLYSGEVGSLIGLTANCLQLYGFGAELISGLGSERDTDRIGAPEQQIDGDFAGPGRLTDQRVELLLEDESPLGLADGMARGGTPVGRITRYLRIGDAAGQGSVETESDRPSQVFLELPETGSDARPASQTQPFFIPGIARAGTVRTLLETANAGTAGDLPGCVKQIQAIIALVQGMIASVTATVEAAHTVTLKTTSIPGGQATQERSLTAGGDDPVDGRPELIHLGYQHEERGQPLGFFSAGGAATPTDPRVGKARAAAESAMRRGVAAELAFIGIPQLESLVDNWQALLGNPASAADAAVSHAGPAYG